VRAFLFDRNLPVPLLEVVLQFARAARMPQLAQRLGLDLPNALASHAELTSDLFKRPRMTVNQPETQSR